jgi:hypothetical protein
MRIPFPTRIPVLWASVFAVGLLIVQQFEHTNFFFSLLFFAFVMLTVTAFNTAGGFSRPSGGYVFFFGVLTCIFGVVWKALLGEPADSNLEDPLLTMAAYVGSMACMVGLVYVARHLLKGRRSFASRMGSDSLDLGDASLGCLVMAVSLEVINDFSLLPGGNGSLINALNHINFFYPLAIILGTLHTIRSSRGRRSVGFVNLVAGILMLYAGMISFSKQGMFTGIVCWAVAAASTGLRLTRTRIIVLGVFALIAFRYLVPLSQVGRDLIYEGEPESQRLATVVDLLSHPVELRAQYNAVLIQSNESAAQGYKIGYYNTAQGFAERLAMIATDDQLIAYTGRGHVEGLAPLEFDFINLIPHFILPKKENLDVGGGKYSNHGNYYAHEIGNIPNDDTSTGISFSSTAEAFHLASWLGVLLLAPIVWGAVFLISDYLYGDPRTSPWALFMLVYFSHSAPEGSLGATIQGEQLGSIALLSIMYFSIHFAPIIGSLFAGGLKRNAAFAAPTPASRPTRAAATL